MNEKEARIYASDLRHNGIPCGDCNFEEPVVEVGERLYNVEKLIQLRNEEDIRMAERFQALREGQERIEQKTDSNTESIQAVKEIALQNNRDLNNGLKSKVHKIEAEQMKIADALQSHVLMTPSEAQREEEIRRIYRSQEEKQGEKKHKTIERLATAIGVFVALDVLGFFDWLVTKVGL